MDNLTLSQAIDLSVIQSLVGGSRAQVKDLVTHNPNCTSGNWAKHLVDLKPFIINKIISKLKGAR